MKVLHLITTIDRGGAETQLLELVNQQVRDGIRVAVLPLKGSMKLKREFESFGATVIVQALGKHPLKQLSFVRHLLDSKNAYDLVHAHLPRSELLACLATKNKVPLFVSRHNSEPFLPDGLSLFSRMLSRFVIARSRKVICISESVKRHILNNREILRGDESKLSVVNYGYSSRAFTQKAYRYAGPPKRILTISRLVEQKDIRTMMLGFQIYRTHVRDAQLTIVGMGTQKNELKDLSHTLGIEKGIVWVDEVSNSVEFISNFEMFLLTSKYEGFGLVLLEAMQAGVPCIVSASDAAVEVLGETFLGLFQVGDFRGLGNKMLTFFSPLMPKEILSQQSLRLQLFEPKKMARKICLLYALKD